MTTAKVNEFDEYDDYEELEENHEDNLLAEIFAKADAFSETIQSIFNDRVDMNLAKGYLKRKGFGEAMQLNLKQRIEAVRARNLSQNLLEGK